MIPGYIAKPLEEAARAVVVAVITYVLMAVASGGVPTTSQGVVALLSGAVPVIYAAIRQALNNTPLTPPDAREREVRYVGELAAALIGMASLVLAGCGSTPPADRSALAPIPHPYAESTPAAGDGAAAFWVAFGSITRSPPMLVDAAPARENPPEPVPRAVRPLSSTDWAILLDAYPDWSVTTMLAIIGCESGGGASAISDPPDADGLRNYGGLQLHGDPEGLRPAYAVDQARQKYDADREAGGDGLGPWRGSRGCWG